MDKYYENLGHKNNVILFMPSVSYQVQFSLYHLHCTIACLFVLVTLCSIDLIIPNSKWRMQNPRSETQIMPGVFLPKRIVLFCCVFFCFFFFFFFFFLSQMAFPFSTTLLEICYWVYQTHHTSSLFIMSLIPLVSWDIWHKYGVSLVPQQ